MKILHFADLHLGMESYGNPDPTTGLSTRLLDILKALDQVADYAIENHVDLVLFCGDAYRSRDPTQTQQREFAKRLRRLSQEDIPVFLLIGNHDLPMAVGKATTMEIFDTLAVNNLYVASRPDIYRIPTRDGYLQIAALPWLRRSVYLSKEATKNLSVDEINTRLEEIMTQKLLELITKVDPNLPCILAAHVFVSSAKFGSEKGMLIGKDLTLLHSNVAQPVFDYIALGHCHHHQVLSTQPPMVYAGSLERLDFSDEGAEKGVYVVDINLKKGKRQVTYQFQQLPARPFLTIKIEVKAEDPEPMATILQVISQHQTKIKDAIVKLQLLLPPSLEPLVNEPELRKALKEAHYTAIAKELKTEPRSRLGNWTAEELTPMEALKIYLQTKKVPASRQKTLLKYGESLIEENLSLPK